MYPRIGRAGVRQLVLEGVLLGMDVGGQTTAAIVGYDAGVTSNIKLPTDGDIDDDEKKRDETGQGGVGDAVGARDGLLVGFERVGEALGDRVVGGVGAVGGVGLDVGLFVGRVVGCFVGCFVGVPVHRGAAQ